MNQDIRINVGFFQHHKTKKLIYKLDYKGVVALLSLWTYAAQNKPKGKLTNMDKIDIALSACWVDDADLFVDTLVDIGFLEDNKGTYSIHDWEKNNPYAFHADERSEHARKAAQARWGDTKGMQGACSEHADSNAPSPSPSPNPNPEPELDYSTVDIIIDFLNEKANMNFQHKKTSRQPIHARLHDGASLEDCLLVIEYSVADWLNDTKMERHLCPQTLFRASNFEKYLGNAIKWVVKNKPNLQENITEFISPTLEQIAKGMSE